MENTTGGGTFSKARQGLAQGRPQVVCSLGFDVLRSEPRVFRVTKKEQNLRYANFTFGLYLDQEIIDLHGPKNEGWSVGFTPRTSDQNPEFVGIKIKDEPGSSTESSLEWNPTYDHDFSHAHAQGSYPEDDELADISRVLVVTAIVIAVQVGKPFLRRFFEEKIVPFYLRAKNARAEGRNRREKGKNARIAEAKRPGTALAIQEANLTTDEAKMIFAQAMMAQHFANEKMRLLAAARIENPGQTQKLFEKFKKLSQPDVAKALTQLLVDNPNLLSELAAARAEGQLPSPQELRRLLEK